VWLHVEWSLPKVISSFWCFWKVMLLPFFSWAGWVGIKNKIRKERKEEIFKVCGCMRSFWKVALWMLLESGIAALLENGIAPLQESDIVPFWKVNFQDG